MEKPKKANTLLLIGSFVLILTGLLLFFKNYVTLSHYLIIGGVVVHILYLWRLGSWDKVKTVIARRALENAIACGVIAAILLYKNSNPQTFEYVIAIIGVAYLIVYLVIKFGGKYKPAA